MITIDAAFTIALWRTGGADPRRGRLLAPLRVLDRPALLSPLRHDPGGAGRWRPAGGPAPALGDRRPDRFGAAVKLWPALLIPAFLAARTAQAGRHGVRGRRLRTGADQPDHRRLARLISPLTWQSGRGLQIESIWATPLMMARAVRPRWVVDISRFQAYEIFGPGVTRLTQQRGHRGRSRGSSCSSSGRTAPAGLPDAVGLVILATVAIMTITNKTLSPQYLLWLGGPMAALLLLRDEPPGRTARPSHGSPWPGCCSACADAAGLPGCTTGFLGSWDA